MELPICKGTYSNESDECEYLDSVLQVANEFIEQYRPSFPKFFAGLCYSCNSAPWSWKRVQPLRRCGGCQLVAYCSRACQRNDWSTHKYVCKEFPMVNGKNALHTSGHWKEHIESLREQASRLKHAEVAANPIFLNPRVCNTCQEAQPNLLTDCECACVSYCSKACAKSDKPHKLDCDYLVNIANTYCMTYMDSLPSIQEETLCKHFTITSTWGDIIPSKFIPSLEILMTLDKGIGKQTSSSMEYCLFIERLSYPMTLLYALQSLPGRHLGLNQKPLEELTTLDIHVVISSLMLSSEPWELFMHRLPKLKQLNVVFVMQGNVFKTSYQPNISVSLMRCEDCKVKDRVITYSVHQMPYHMFFSSEQYTEPDVVVVYGNTEEMKISEENDIHTQISYRNMIYNPATVLVLTDVTKEMLRQGVRAVNAAQPVMQLVSPLNNPLKGFSSHRADINSDVAIINERTYLTCLRRK